MQLTSKVTMKFKLKMDKSFLIRVAHTDTDTTVILLYQLDYGIALRTKEQMVLVIEILKNSTRVDY